MAIKDFYDSFIVSPLDGGGFTVIADKIVVVDGENTTQKVYFGFTDFADLAVWFQAIKDECGA